MATLFKVERKIANVQSYCFMGSPCEKAKNVQIQFTEFLLDVKLLNMVT